MNTDTLLDAYMRSLINTDINEETFLQYIDFFSKYLGYTNPSYKYNGTYLKQYVDEFIKSCKDLTYKNEIYNRLYAILIVNIGIPFELIIDNSYYGYFDKIENPQGNVVVYKKYDKARISSDKFEIRFKVEHEKEEYIFCKEYDGENIDLIVNEVILFLQVKGLWKENK